MGGNTKKRGKLASSHNFHDEILSGVMIAYISRARKGGEDRGEVKGEYGRI